MRFVLTLLTILGLAYAAACAWLYFTQRAMIYYPQFILSRATANTETLRVPDAELKLTVRSRDGRAALLYFGGNAEDVAFNLPELAAVFPDHALYLLHYRGYGGSSGSPSEAALHADALALYDKVVAAHPDVMVIGRSLGSGVAVRLASVRPVQQLVLVTPYYSIVDIAAKQFPMFPVRWLLQDRYESWRDAPQVRATTLVLTAERDQIVPRDSTQRLLARFGPGVAVERLIAGTDHISISASPQYWMALQGLRGATR